MLNIDNQNLTLNKMIDNRFITCAGCNNKSYVGLDCDGNKIYHCDLVEGIVKDGIVFDTTDASDCLKYDLYKQE